MTVQDLIDKLMNYDKNLDAVIYVPGDDFGYWPMEDAKFEIDNYADPKGNKKEDMQFLKIIIY